METGIELTAERIKGLAHPLRVAMLALLRGDGPATASQLARALDTTSGATSYHLRELAKHGFISEKTGAGSGRERYWEAAHRYTEVIRSQLDNDPQALALLDEFVRLGSARREADVVEWLATQEKWGSEWASAVALDDHLLQLTSEELADLHQTISSVILEWSTRPAADVPEGAEPVVLHLLAFPTASWRDRFVEYAKSIADR